MLVRHIFVAADKFLAYSKTQIHINICTIRQIYIYNTYLCVYVLYVYLIMFIMNAQQSYIYIYMILCGCSVYIRRVLSVFSESACARAASPAHDPKCTALYIRAEIIISMFILYDILINIYSLYLKTSRPKYAPLPHPPPIPPHRIPRAIINVHKHSYFVNKFTLSSSDDDDDCATHKTMICPYKLVI